ncbi:rhodanese-like domain-containing protein [Psychroflexus sp. CAK8W]|uniref:Rhodanese-like domain-containing protein n=1 Tax=Psychroflexus longus TaxID=2873596 RepID=A0ABS7XIS8_9FLAO|nr:rhodanese-like domain-containing protein [Psychroflexus longus]MBZ9777902.1 rhodanese-like domain-containing protein [Psychroflexus longus]
MNLKFSLFLIVSPLIGFAQSKMDDAIKEYNSNSVEYISVEDLIQLKNSNANIKLLDTREASEYSISHIQDAVYAGYDDFKLKSIVDKINTKDTIVVYCSIGVRSEDIGERLQKAGYKNVFNLYGGIFDWVNNDQKVYGHEGKLTSKVHAYDRFWGNYLEKGQKVY